MDTEGPCADPDNPDLLGTWEQVDRAMDSVFDPAFRQRFADPSGGTLAIGWFFLTWTGFDTNPRQRDFGYHRVRDHYLARWGETLRAGPDEECWHYHHPAANKVGNEWGLDWSASGEYQQILSRQVLERDWFPSVFRAGGTILTEESSRWVDAWFPLDYSNRAPVKLPGLVDWSTGVAEWSLYHPSPEDFRRPGHGRRRMARCLDLMTGVYALSEQDVVNAFERAAAGRSSLLAVFEHDYRDIEGRLDAFRELLTFVSGRYPHVPWRYAGPRAAVHAYLEAPRRRPLLLEATSARDGIVIWSSAPLFQSFPWIAARTSDGQVHHVDSGIERLDETHWRWTPPGWLDWEEASIGGATDVGEEAVAHIRRADPPFATFLREPVRADPVAPRSVWEHSKLFVRSSIDRAAGTAPEMDSVAQAMEYLHPRLEAGMSILDVGCAAGHLARSLPSGVHYEGVDSARRIIEVGRAVGELPRGRLRWLSIEELPAGETYDAVISLNTLLYLPQFELPLEAMARAACRWLVIRSSFGETCEVRYLPDVLLEPSFHTMRAYFAVHPRAEVQSFLESEGFRVEWHEDRRQRVRFGGQPEVVGGIDLPYEFLIAERVAPSPSEDAILGERFGAAATAWHEHGEEGPSP